MSEFWRDRLTCQPTTLHSDNHNQYKDVVRREQRRRRQSITTRTASSLECSVTGNTMEEWWSSLSSFLGAKRSRLHYDILSFCKEHELNSEHTRIRKGALEYFEEAVKEVWPDAKVHLCGSTATGLAIPISDVDFVVVMLPAGIRRYYGATYPDTAPFVSELYNHLLNDHETFQSLFEIPRAKVPIIKAVFNNSGLACDISFDWTDYRARQGVQVVQELMQRHEYLQPLCVVLKFFLKRLNLNEVFSGGIGSFCLTIMIASHLHNLGNEGAVNDLGALLLSFFVRYGRFHIYETDVVTALPGNCSSKQSRGWVNFNFPGRLAVENPLDPSSDVGSASYRIYVVREKFRQAMGVLSHNWDKEKVLDLLFSKCVA